MIHSFNLYGTHTQVRPYALSSTLSKRGTVLQSICSSINPGRFSEIMYTAVYGFGNVRSTPHSSHIFGFSAFTVWFCRVLS
jgi:hypothetical protein